MTQALFRDDAYRTETEAIVASSGPRGVALDRTVFYSQGGGQSGDRGTLIIESGSPMAVVNTVYDADRATILHLPADGAVLPTSAISACAPIPRSICSRSCCPIR
jgi:misacylated tRNA(Ala) deacylase